MRAVASDVAAYFTEKEFSEVRRAALVTFSTSWRLIYRLVLSWRVTKRLGHRSRRKGNTLVWVVWASMSVMLVCLVLWAATGAVPLLFGAVLAGLGCSTWCCSLTSRDPL
jgi:fatty acid desaturase